MVTGKMVVEDIIGEDFDFGVSEPETKGWTFRCLAK